MTGPPVAADTFERLRRLVLADPALCRVLDAITDREELMATLTALAREHGLALEPADVDSALIAARRLWLERWI